MSLFDCVKCVSNIIRLDAACEACSAGDVLLCPTCVEQAIRAYRNCTSCADQLLANVLSALGLGGKMACTTTHTSKVQGAGLCCQAVQSGQLVAPPPGTTLPVYAPHQAAAVFAAGRGVMVTDAAGHCASCMIVGSRSAKHPGRPVLKFIRGGPSCPSSTTGCCALTPGA